MAMILKNQDSRSEIQSKVAADLEARLNQTKQIDHEKIDPAFLEKQHQTRGAGILIVVLLVVLIAAVVWSVSQLS